MKQFFASLRSEFAGYNAARLGGDVMAGLTVCAVALPLALAFGVSSGASAAAGLVTAIVAGVVIALLGGASYQVSGPTGDMSAVLVGIVARYGLQGVFLACFAAGALLLAAGLLRLGKLISFIPMPVIMGFTSGIALVIALGQVDNFFGTVSEGSTNLEKLASCARLGYLMAQERGVDPDLAACACAIHDIGRVLTGRQAGHAEAGAHQKRQQNPRQADGPQ